MSDTLTAVAARHGSAKPVFVNVAHPGEAGPGEVLCQTLELGVCGTDREILASTHPLVPPGDDFLVLGHECLARVVQAGDGVELQPGQLVVPTVRRPNCASPVRVDMLSFGDYTERGIVQQHGFTAAWWIDDPQFLLPVADEITPVAVLAEPLAVAEKAANEAITLQQARLAGDTWNDPPPRVLITGMGPIAFAAVLACRARGWPATMLGRDSPSTYRARLAREFGAAYASTETHDLAPDNVERDGFDLLLECTGSDKVLLMAVGALASRGAAVWLGSSRSGKPATHDVARLMRTGLVRNHIHIGSVNAAPRDFEHALAHLAQLHRTHAKQLSSLITTRVTPDSSLWQFEQRAPQGIKVVLMYE